MSLLEIIRAVFADIRVNKSRAFLTTLGILVGSLTITLVVGIGVGGQKAIRDEFDHILNPGMIMIWPDGGQRLNHEAVEALRDRATYLRDVTLVTRFGQQVYHRQYEAHANIAGVYENFLHIYKYELDRGRFFAPEDQETLQRVGVLGYALVEQLFQGDPALAVGSNVKINGVSYEVIGTLRRSDTWEGDNQVFLPYRTAVRFTMQHPDMGWSQLTALAKDLKQVDEAVEQTKQVLADHYPGSTPDSFYVYDMDRQLRSAQRADLIMTLMLVGVASLVLLVGGIGIMNVLLVSIKERTKEIGILKAIGTRRGDILLQFLLQAIFISLAGGLLGVAISYAATPLVKKFSEIYTPSLLGVYVAVGFSIVTGTFFGYYPARKAAGLRPIAALNDE